MSIQFSAKCGQKHEIMDKNFESTYEYLSESRNVHTIFWKMWTKTWNYGQTFRVYLWTFMNIQVNPENVDNIVQT